MNKLEDLIYISRFYGKNPAYILAGGGNSSYKDEDKLWVKASGSSMAEIDESGFVCLSRKKLGLISQKRYSDNSSKREEDVKADLHAAILYPENKRPSVETSMHEIIDFPFVVHTHPTLVNALMCSKNAKKQTVTLFGDRALYIEYTDPGYVLFKKVETEILNYRNKYVSEPAIIFLQNHGVFVGAQTKEEIVNIYKEIEIILRKNITQELPDEKELLSLKEIEKYGETLKKNLGIDDAFCLYRENKLIQHFIKDKNAFEKVNKPFTPDDIVYCKSKYVFTTSDPKEMLDAVHNFRSKNGYLPKVVAIEDKGILAIEENIKSATTVLDIFQNMMKVSFYSENFGGPQFMTADQISFIDNWEVENYRRKVAKEG